jgi:hypothetical protein
MLITKSVLKRVAIAFCVLSMVLMVTGLSWADTLYVTRSHASAGMGNLTIQIIDDGGNLSMPSQSVVVPNSCFNPDVYWNANLQKWILSGKDETSVIAWTGAVGTSGIFAPISSPGQAVVCSTDPGSPYTVVSDEPAPTPVPTPVPTPTPTPTPGPTPTPTPGPTPTPTPGPTPTPTPGPTPTGSVTLTKLCDSGQSFSNVAGKAVRYFQFTVPAGQTGVNFTVEDANDYTKEDVIVKMGSPITQTEYNNITSTFYASSSPSYIIMNGPTYFYFIKRGTRSPGTILSLSFPALSADTNFYAIVVNTTSTSTLERDYFCY